MSRVERMKAKRKENRRATRYFIRDIIIAMVISFAVLVCISPSKVKERSMQPTINDGDIVLINKLFYNEIERGDIIVFDSELKDDKGNSLKLIKRVIGIEGDKVDIKDNKIFVNDQALKEDYIYESPTGNIVNQVTPPGFIVPKGEVYVLGDHREVSRDSRQLGTIKEDKIVGHAVFRVFPFGSIGSLN